MQMSLQYGQASPNLQLQYLQVQHLNMARLCYSPSNSLSLHLFFCIFLPFPLFRTVSSILSDADVGSEKHRFCRIVFLYWKLSQYLLIFIFCRCTFFVMVSVYSETQSSGISPLTHLLLRTQVRQARECWDVGRDRQSKATWM